MDIIRRGAERGHADHGWLKSFHTFSFGSYHDPAHMGFGPLRVINEDRIVAGAGFGTHSHRDMEIVSYVLDGELAHRDSLGNGSTLRPGDVQRMSAGTGVSHSEFNPSSASGTHFLQIWLLPDVVGLPPSYQEKRFDSAAKRGRLRLLVSPNGAQDSLHVHQDARLYAGLFDAGEAFDFSVAPHRGIYVHVARGRIVLNDSAFAAGDALMITDAKPLRFRNGDAAEVLVFDLPLSAAA